MPSSTPRKSAAPRPPRGIQSVEVGGQLLRALVHQGRPMALKDLASGAQMTAAKAHPYLVSFGKLGLIVQDGTTGHYGLGPLAMQLGLISLQQVDPVRLATPLLAELAQRVGHTIGIGVWGSRGATIVRIEEAPRAVYVNMRHGTVMSLRGTASGRLFAAYLPRALVRAALAAEGVAERGAARKRRGDDAIDSAFAAVLDEVCRHGVSRTEDAAVPGVSAAAAPVFDAQGTIVMSLTAIGPSASFDTRLAGAVVPVLLKSARQLSAQLGASRAHP
jgi:DNA-binding IclR family transcriptional regulator